MKTRIRLTILICLVCSFLTSTYISALEIQYEGDSEVLLSNLLTPSTEASDPWFWGNKLGIGTYTNISNLWNLGDGIILSSGNVQDYEDGINTSGSFSTDLYFDGDNDLTELSGYATYDATSFGFDFTASNDTISYDFVFCSEEFDEFVGSSFNDVFGVWLEDFSGFKTQLSYDTDNNPITVNETWMSGGNPPDNTTGTEFDGCTIKLRTSAKVAKGQNYSIKFAISDSSDHVYDSAVYLSNFKGASQKINQPKMYGLFIGYKEESDTYDDLRGDLAAKMVRDSFLRLYNVEFSHLIIGDKSTGGISQHVIESAISEIKNKMQADDILWIYFISHGSVDVIGPESTKTYGDEYLKIGEGIIGGENYFTDDELYELLADIDNINKWIFIDACHSGGFWGNNDSNDVGDLEKLENIYFMASADEGENAYYDTNGIPLFALALDEATNTNSGGNVLADENLDGAVSFQELEKWIKNYATLYNYQSTVVVEMELGDRVIFSLDKWTPVAYKNVTNDINIFPIVDPEPVTVSTDTIEPLVDIINPEFNDAVQGTITFSAKVESDNIISNVSFYLLTKNGEEYFSIGYDDISAIFDSSSNTWKVQFDTTNLDDGYYALYTSAIDEDNNEGLSYIVPFSIKNWALTETLPASSNYKAGRTVPVKFGLNIDDSVDPMMPFVINENLEIRIYEISSPNALLQVSHFGPTSIDYRIDHESRIYITNFKTAEKPKTYVVEVWRLSNDYLLGSFTFETIKK